MDYIKGLLRKSGGGTQPKRDSPTNTIKGGITVIEENSNSKKSSVTGKNIIDDVNTETHDTASSPKEPKLTSDESVLNISNGLAPATPKSEFNFSLLANKLNSLHISTPLANKKHLAECDERLDLSTDSLEVIADESVFLSFDSSPVREGALSREEGKFSLAIEEEPKGNDSTLVEEAACIIDEITPVKTETQPQNLEVRKLLQFEIPTVDITGTSPHLVEGNINPIANDVVDLTKSSSPSAISEDHINTDNSVSIEDDLSSFVASLKINESVVNNSPLIENYDKLNISNEGLPNDKSSNTIVNNLPLTVDDNKLNLSTEELITDNSSNTILNVSNNSAENISDNFVNNTSFKLEDLKLHLPIEELPIENSSDVKISNESVDIDAENISNLLVNNSSFTVDDLKLKSEVESGPKTVGNNTSFTLEDLQLNLPKEELLIENSSDVNIPNEPVDIDTKNISNLLVNNSSFTVDDLKLKSQVESGPKTVVNNTSFTLEDLQLNLPEEESLIENSSDVKIPNEPVDIDTKSISNSLANNSSFTVEESQVENGSNSILYNIEEDLNLNLSADFLVDNKEDETQVESGSNTLVNNSSENLRSIEVEAKETYPIPLADDHQVGVNESDDIKLELIECVEFTQEETLNSGEVISLVDSPFGKDSEPKSNISIYEIKDDTSSNNSSCYIVEDDNGLPTEDKVSTCPSPVPVDVCLELNKSVDSLIVEIPKECIVKTPIKEQETQAIQIPSINVICPSPVVENKTKESSSSLVEKSSVQILDLKLHEETVVEEETSLLAEVGTDPIIPTEEIPLVVCEENIFVEVPKEKQNLTFASKEEEFSLDPVVQNCDKEPEESQNVLVSQKEENSISLVENSAHEVTPKKESPIISPVSKEHQNDIIISAIEETSIAALVEETSESQIPPIQVICPSSVCENTTKESSNSLVENSSVQILDLKLHKETVVKVETSLPAEVGTDPIIPTEKSIFVVPEEDSFVEVPKEHQHSAVALKEEEFSPDILVQNCVKEPEESQNIAVRREEENSADEVTPKKENSIFSPVSKTHQNNIVASVKEETPIAALVEETSAFQIAPIQVICPSPVHENTTEVSLNNSFLISFSNSPSVPVRDVKIDEETVIEEIGNFNIRTGVTTKEETSHPPVQNSVGITGESQSTCTTNEEILVAFNSLSIDNKEYQDIEITKEETSDAVSHVQRPTEECSSEVLPNKETSNVSPVPKEHQNNIVVSTTEEAPIVALVEKTSAFQIPFIQGICPSPVDENKIKESSNNLIQGSSVPVEETVVVGIDSFSVLNSVAEKIETSQLPIKITTEVVEDIVTPTLVQESLNNSTFTTNGETHVTINSVPVENKEHQDSDKIEGEISVAVSPAQNSTEVCKSGVVSPKSVSPVPKGNQNNLVISAKEEKPVVALVEETLVVSKEASSDFAGSGLSQLDLIKGVHVLGGVASNENAELYSPYNSSTDGFCDGTDSIDTVREISLDYNNRIREEAKRVAQDILNSSRSSSSSSNTSGMEQKSPIPRRQPLLNQTQCMMRSAVSSEINRSEAGPVTADEHFQEGESFQDGKSFDFDYLAKFGNKGQSKLSRQSLFVKFDPLFDHGTPDKDNNPEKRLSVMSESAGSDNESKITKESGATTPKRLTKPEEKLISMTPEKIESPPQTWTKVNANSPSTPTLKQDILSREISKLQTLMVQQEQSYQEQLTSKSEMIEKLMKRISELEAKEPRDDLENKLKTSEAMCSKLKKELSESNTSKKQLIMIMEEYEKTISQLVTKREDEKKEFEQLKENIASERDSALLHLNNLEVAFNDIHQKYERCKQVIESLKNNEMLLKESLTENEKTINKQEGDYLKLKKHASDMLEAANEELATLRKNHLGEVAKLKAIAKKFEIKVKSLEESLEQKQKEVLELTQICDELIAKMS